VRGRSIAASASHDVIGRRGLLSGAIGAALSGGLARATPVAAANDAERAAPPLRARSAAYDAVAFDGFVIFDPRPIAATAESIVPGKGAALVNAWRIRQFDYQWLRALGGRYTDFMQTTAAALHFASVQLGIDLDTAAKRRLLDVYANLPVWPDVPASLASLRESGLRLAMLSNMTHTMLADGLARGGVASLVETVLSTDAIATYKPDLRAYQLGVDALHLPKERILFAAFAGWDVAGATWFGYPTFWVNRLDAAPEALDVTPNGAGKDLAALVQFAA
jgi:2-haloacid dehalogenase